MNKTSNSKRIIVYRCQVMFEYVQAASAAASGRKVQKSKKHKQGINKPLILPSHP
jgi:hypothetical protein